VSEYNILQNNGKLAHQAVFHVHFHIIPKPSDQSGLSIVWNATELDDGEAVSDAIRKAL
jgi:diadenosine tetraphosphate (Ap4A) HIT family hydrolase